MKRKRVGGRARTILALTSALALAGLAGCRQTDAIRSRVAGRRPSLSTGGPTAPATRKQEADVQISLGRAAERRGEYEQAMIAYKEALTRDKSRADAYQRLAVLHDRRGDFRRSAELYRQALEAAPGSAEVYCDMGYSLYLQRRWAESERNLKQAIALKPDMARAHNNLGMVLAHDCRVDEALAEYRKAGNDEAQARGNLALALAVEGDVDAARAQYQLALAADPKADGPKERLRELDALAARTSTKAAPASAVAARPAPARAVGATPGRPSDAPAVAAASPRLPAQVRLPSPKSDLGLVPASAVSPAPRGGPAARP